MGSEPQDPSKYRAAYYRARAAEARARAEAMSDLEAKATMMQVAAMWDKEVPPFKLTVPNAGGP